MVDKIKPNYAVPALDKGLDILEFLAKAQMPCTQSEIAIGINRSTNEMYRVLMGLEKRGYLHRDPQSGRYDLSLKLYNLSRSISPIDRVRQAALPNMEDLAVSVGQSCYLSMLYQSQAMVVVNARSKSPMHLSIAEGAVFTLSCSTAGKLLLANSNNQVRAMLIDHEPAYRLLKEAELSVLYHELDSISEHGYLIQKNNLISGVYDFSVLIGQPNAKIIAALTISSFDIELTSTSNMNSLLFELKTTAQKISSMINN